jgi:periplasmic mercuric ion binding protein
MIRPVLGLFVTAVLLAPAAGASAAERTVTLGVENMYCAACPHIVRQTLIRVPGVQRVEVSYRARTATVTFDDARTGVAALTAAAAEAGYPASLRASGS